MLRIAIVGIGRVGGALAKAFTLSRDIEIKGLYGRKKLESVAELDEVHEIDADAVILTVPDSAIPSVSQIISTKLAVASTVFHTSGALSSDELSTLRDAGHSVASLHPLVSLTGETPSDNDFTGTYFGIEGDAKAVAVGERIVAGIGAKSIAVRPDLKPLYHAAAVAACGNITALIDVAVEMMTSAGVPESHAERALIPLVKSTLANIERVGRAKALTGTFARADVDGFGRQLRSFEGKLTPEQIEIYLLLAEQSLSLAATNGAPSDDIEKIRIQIAMAKDKLR